MIVGQDNGDRPGQHGSLEDFSRGDWGRVGGTDRHDRVGGYLILSVKIKSDEVFSAVVGQDGSNEVRHIGGAADPEHHVFAVEVVHSGFTNEGVLDVWLWAGGLLVVGCFGVF